MHGKANIANLFAQLSLFIPEREEGKWTGKFLVNQTRVAQLLEKGDKVFGVNCPPERDDLLHLIGMASQEMAEFIRDYDKVMQTVKEMDQTSSEELKMVKAILPDVTDELPGYEMRKIVYGRYKAAIDVLHHIAHHMKQEMCKQTAIEFLGFKVERIETLVNQKTYQDGFKDGVKYMNALEDEAKLIGRAFGELNDDDLNNIQLKKWKEMNESNAGQPVCTESETCCGTCGFKHDPAQSCLPI